MENSRYANTLEQEPGIVLDVQQVIRPVDLHDPQRAVGYLLADGTVLCEKDENDFYLAAATEGDAHPQFQVCYEPVWEEVGEVTGFRQMSQHLSTFSGEEQKLIYQYAMNTKENLLDDLGQLLRVMKNPELHQRIAGTRDKLSRIPDRECVRLMADIRAAYKGRHLESIRQRQKMAQKSPAGRRRKRSIER